MKFPSNRRLIEVITGTIAAFFITAYIVSETIISRLEAMKAATNIFFNRHLHYRS